MNVVLLVVIVVFVLILFGNMVKIVRPYQKGVLERLGKYQVTLNSGINLVIPFFDKLRYVDIRERVVDVPPQDVITKDNVVVTVDAVIFYQVMDPPKSIYNIRNFNYAISKLAQTNLRNLIGTLALDESLTSRETINTDLRMILDEATDIWGVKVKRVELQRIEPPADVTEAMHRQMKAERDRRAIILEAEGQRQAAIEKATGERQADILQAEGQGKAIQIVADANKYQKIALATGESEAVERVYKAIHNGNPTKDLIAIKYLETLEKLADGKATKMIVPFESSGILGSLAQIKEIFEKDTKTDIE
ncbi:SPFH/Band 7/PHB domain protein [bacterium]|nr:SPFH/Band 7/PHB domain protein [bacterium]